MRVLRFLMALGSLKDPILWLICSFVLSPWDQVRRWGYFRGGHRVVALVPAQLRVERASGLRRVDRKRRQRQLARRLRKVGANFGHPGLLRWTQDPAEETTRSGTSGDS